MLFDFLKDEQLFQCDRGTPQGLLWFESGLSAAVNEKVREICSRGKSSFKVYGTTGYEQHQYEEKKANRALRSLYEEIEPIVDKYADEKELGSFPASSLIAYTQGNTEYTFDYFKEMDKAGWNTSGVGRTGRFLSAVQNCVDRAERKTTLLGGMEYYFLCLIVFFLLCCGAQLPLIPDILPSVMNGEYGFWARLVVGLIMGGSSAFFMMFGFQHEDGLMKIVGNGLFQIILCGGGILGAASLVMNYPSTEATAMFFWPFAAYYALVLLCLILENIKQNKKIRADWPVAKKAMCKLVEEEIEHFHRYIRLHVIWWEALHGKKELPQGLKNMQKSFDRVLKAYEKYSN